MQLHNDDASIAFTPVVLIQAATALSAVFQFFIRDVSGMLGGILFAYVTGGSFDSNAKQWRLFADIVNDISKFS